MTQVDATRRGGNSAATRSQVTIACGGLFSGGLGQTTRFKNHGTWLSVRSPHILCTDNGLNAWGHSNAVKYDSLLYFSGLPINELHAKAGKTAAEPYCCDFHLTESS